MRTWTMPRRIIDQHDSAMVRACADVKEFNTGRPVRMYWGNTYKVEEEWQRDGLVRIQFKNSRGEMERMTFDVQELLYWLKYA